MNRTVLTTFAITGIACCAVLVAQASKNRSLRDGIVAKEETVAGLKRELRQLDPLTSLVDARRPLPNAQQDDEVARGQVAPLSKEATVRVERARDSIDRLVEELGDLDRTPMAFFKVIPDILRIVQDLSLDEMIEVAQGIDVPTEMGRPDGKVIARMVLLMLAAEEDPLRVMQNESVMADRQIRQSILSQLARRDPDAAREWVEESDLTKREKDAVENFITFNVMRSDVGAGLKLFRELRNSGGDGASRFSELSEMPMPDKLIPDLVDAHKDPANEDLRDVIGGMILRNGIFNGGIAATRERAALIDLTQQELSNFFVRDLSELINIEPDAALGWMVEVLDDQWQQKTLPSVISSWAREDFNAAGGYLGKMEASKTKDMAIKEFAGTVSQIDPEAASVWALEITDEMLRRDAVARATGQWRFKDRVAADAWLEANGLDQNGRPVE